MSPIVDRDAELKELLREVRHIEVQSRRLVSGAMSGGYGSVFRGRGIEFDEVREYAEGDDPRAIDWNVTARVGRPFIKKYVDERELTVLFLLDLSPSMTGGLGAWSARQAAARVCACLALSALRNHDKVGLIGFGDEVATFVPARKGLGHVLRLVRDCLALEAAPASRSRLEPVLRFAASVLRRRAILFLVSDFLFDAFADPATSTSRSATSALALCARRHDVIAIRMLTPELAAPSGPQVPFGDRLIRLRDPETGRRLVVDGSSERVRASFAERIVRWRARITAELGRAGVDLVDVVIPSRPSQDAIVRPILDFFRMRELRGSKR